MLKVLLNNIFRILLFALLLGLAGGILLEVIFKLQYRNFMMLQSLRWFWEAIGLSIIFVFGLYYLNKQLDKKVPWDRRPLLRLNMQLLFSSLAGLIVFSGLRPFYTYYIWGSKFILLNDELTIAIFTLVFILIINLIDFGVILINQWRFSLAQVEKYKKESAEFEFEMLRAQINPHFLFNSLNTLSSLVYESADKAAEFIRRLSDVYRHVLESRHKELIPVREELAFTDSYIFLLMLRFGNKLSISIVLEEKLQERLIAPLTLQLLIENAVKHNIVSENKPLHIDIYYENNYIVVENPLQPKAVEESGNGMGLRNISSRYMALSDKEVLINNENNKFTVKIPVL